MVAKIPSRMHSCENDTLQMELVRAREVPYLVVPVFSPTSAWELLVLSVGKGKSRSTPIQATVELLFETVRCFGAPFGRGASLCLCGEPEWSSIGNVG
jgi:hypothetical protein